MQDATVFQDVMIGTVQARWRLKYLGRMIEDCVAPDRRVGEGRRPMAGDPPAFDPGASGGRARVLRGIEWPARRRRRAGDDVKELTIRGIILGALITVIFTAANVYLGLKIGITFATSIPAAVISMAVLKAFRDSTIQENNIVQTIASAAGTLSAIIFVLPGLIMVGWWTGFPYWLSVAVIGIGGILGVMYSVPLRRALVTGTDLPYPEGVAAAEVLKVGAGVGGAEENRRGLVLIGGSTIVAAFYFLLAKTRLLTDTAAQDLPRRRRRVRNLRKPVDGADRRRPPRRRRRRPRHGRRHDHHLGVHRPALDAGCRPHRRRRLATSRSWSAPHSGRRRAWSARARSASPQSGRC